MLFNVDQLVYTLLFAGFMLTFFGQFYLLSRCAKMKSRDRLSSNCLMNMFAWCFGSLSAIVYIGYMCHCNGQMANGHFLFWSSLSYASFTMLISISVTCLLVDRMFIFLSPRKYKQKRPKFIFFTFLFCICVAFICIPLLSFNELPIDENVQCQFGSVLKRNNGVHVNAARFLLGFFNLTLFVVFLFIYCLHSSPTVNRQFKRINVISFVAALTEIFCSFLPHIIYLFYKVQYRSGNLRSELAHVPYQIVSLCANGVVTAIMYGFFIFSNRSTKIDSVGESSRRENEGDVNTPPVEESPEEVAATPPIAMVRRPSLDREQEYSLERPRGRYNSINLSQI